MLFSTGMAYFLLFAVSFIAAKKAHRTTAWPPFATSAKGFTHESVYNVSGREKNQPELQLSVALVPLYYMGGKNTLEKSASMNRTLTEKYH